MGEERRLMRRKALARGAESLAAVMGKTARSSFKAHGKVGVLPSCRACCKREWEPVFQVWGWSMGNGSQRTRKSPRSTRRA